MNISELARKGLMDYDLSAPAMQLLNDIILPSWDNLEVGDVLKMRHSTTIPCKVLITYKDNYTACGVYENGMVFQCPFNENGRILKSFYFESSNDLVVVKVENHPTNHKPTRKNQHGKRKTQR